MLKKSNSWLIAALLSAGLLVGCSTTKAPPIQIEYVQVPVPYVPDPPVIKAPVKEAGIEYIDDNTAPGNVAKHWMYEAEYWKRVHEIVNDAYNEYFAKSKIAADQLRDYIEQRVKDEQKK